MTDNTQDAAARHFRGAAPREAGKLRLDEMITQRIRLDQINEAFDAMKKGEAARSVIVFD